MTIFIVPLQSKNDQSIFLKQIDRSRRILVIDDEIDVRLITQCCLENFNHWYVTTVSRDEADCQLKIASWDVDSYLLLESLPNLLIPSL